MKNNETKQMVDNVRIRGRPHRRNNNKKRKPNKLQNN